MSVWFISDIHLKTQEERNGEILLRFLHLLIDEQKKAPLTLFLLGDIFDFWVSDHRVFQKKFSKLVAALQALKQAGAEVIYFEGNHDLHLDRYWQKKLGIQVYKEAQYFHIQGIDFRCEHGDLINIEDEAYIKFRKFVRHPLVEFMGHSIPGIVWDWLGQRLSSYSAKDSRVYREEHEVIMKKMIHAHAERSFEEKKFNYIITGHMHVIDVYELKSNSNKAVSINLGSWLGNEVKALQINKEGYQWIMLK